MRGESRQLRRMMKYDKIQYQTKKKSNLLNLSSPAAFPK